MSNNGTEQLSQKPQDAYNKGKKALGGLKKGRAIFRVLRFVFQKVLLAFLKWLAGILGPFVLGFLLLIILLLIVLDSVMSFDLFQLGNEREEQEVVFDETIKVVFQDRLDGVAEEIRNTIRPTQPPPIYPPISEEWLWETGELMKLSHALPTIHHYYKNLKNENYKPWHKAHNKKDPSEYYKIIDDATAYYFEDDSFQVEYEWGTPPIEEYVEVTTVTSCTSVDKETGKTSTTTSTSKNKTILPKRDIVLSMTHIYHKGIIHYKTVNTVDEDTVSSGDCTSQITTEKQLYLIDEVPITLKFLPKSLVLYLTTDAKEGKYTQLVQAQDLEYMIDIGRETDPRFPKPFVDYEALTACWFAKKDMVKCVDEFVTGGELGQEIFYPSGGGSYPPEYESIYKKAAEACGIDWQILAAVHGVETSYSKNPVATDKNLSSSAGALGHFQFMGLTWLGWSARGDLEKEGIKTTNVGKIVGETPWLYDLSKIAQYGGRGKDGNGDGIADPWNLEDAAYAAACYLKDLGVTKGDRDASHKGLAKYNGGNNPGPAANRYADKVLDMVDRMNNIGGDGGAQIPISPGSLTAPTVGRFTSPFGYRNFGGGEVHYGADIANAVGTPIVSIADGTVSRVVIDRSRNGWGTYIRVKHNVDGKTFESLYAHLDATMVSVGQPVQKGQQIGKMGNTGNSTGPHLHLEIHEPYFISQAQSAKNPESYLKLR